MRAGDKNMVIPFGFDEVEVQMFVQVPNTA